jgi:very-short-patch-repair endonuclease
MLQQAREQVSTFDQRLRRLGDPSTHPWRALAATRLGSEAKQGLAGHLRTAISTLQRLRAASASLAARFARSEPRSLKGVTALIGIGGRLSEAPLALESGTWNDRRWSPGEIDHLTSDGSKYATLRERWQQVFSRDSDHDDWTAVLERRKRGPGLLRWLGSEWRADTRRLRGACSGQLPPRVELIDALAALVEASALRERIETRASSFGDLLATAWRGVDTDWGSIDALANASRRIQRISAQAGLSDAVVDQCLADRNALARASAEISGLEAAFRTAWTTLSNALSTDGSAWLDSTTIDDASLSVLTAALDRASKTISELDEWVSFYSIWNRLREGTLNAFSVWALSEHGKAARGNLAAVFERRFYELWLEAVVDESGILADFHGDEHDEALERFKALDRLWIEATKDRVSALLRERLPATTGDARQGSKAGVLGNEIRKKRNRMPLRRLFHEVGDVVQAIKPCFMMSPVSVAQYLKPGGIAFDVVIFDEASQVEPADAFGAIARGRQVLLVGDEKQLPPTAFFKKIESDEPDRETDDGEGPVADASRDLESILSVGINRLPHRFSLRWHYRSQHETLISFSNHHFYDQLLRVFPSAHTGREEVGVQFRYVAGEYLRGKGRTNPDEVRCVVDEIIRHAHKCPHLTLGVGTFNKPQEQAIRDELERRRRLSPDERLEAFLAKDDSEPFFVKNLETIQGDERDAIFLSVTYGPDATKRIKRNFGPLNGDGGWRRLNVLVTRARAKCVVFTSLRADDIVLDESSPRGVIALKEYLSFAEQGVLTTAAVPSGGYDSPLEEDIAEALRGRGWEVKTQIGVAGFSIDLAIVDPERRGRYLVGVECDGATYHSSPTARDRDRLRQEVLERLGWTILRVWSTDWFKNRERALEGLLKRIEEAKAGPRPSRQVPRMIRMPASRASRAEEPKATYEIGRPRTEQQRPKEVRPYVRKDPRLRGWDMNDTATVVPALIDIVQNEGPIHVEEAGRVLCRAFGTRLTESNFSILNLAITAAVEVQAIERQGDFLRQPGAPIVVRHRAGNCPVTKPELIPPEEYEEAVRVALKREFGLQPDVLHSNVVRIMGFERAGERLKDEVSRAVRRLLDAGEICLDGRGYIVPTG